MGGQGTGHRLQGSVCVGLLAIGLLTASTAAAAATRSGGSVGDACSLLSPGDLRASLHGTVSPGDLTASPDGHESICEWTVTPGHGGGYSVQLDVKSPFTAGDFRQQRRVASGATKTVRRLGDAAFTERAHAAGQVYDDLWVHAGSVAFRLEALKDLGAGPLVPLARTVLAGLAGAAPTP